MPGHFDEAPLEVIGHQLHIVQIPLGLCHVRMQSEIGVSPGRDGEHLALSQGIQLLAQLRQEQGKVLLVPHIGRDSRKGEAGILPVDVYAVQLMCRHQLCRALCCLFPGVLRHGRLGEAVRAPAADGKNDPDLRMNPADALQILLCARAILPYRFVLPDVPEGNVDHIQLSDVLLPHSAQVPGSYIADHFLLIHDFQSPFLVPGILQQLFII